jgi:sugar/nucleoside kinase (ribokinase family)
MDHPPGIGRKSLNPEENNMKTKVFCAGGLVADVITGPLAKLPRHGEVVLVKTMKLFRGGCAANTAYGLARLGVPVDVIGKVGRDFFGGFIRESLRRDGVGTARILTDPEINSTSCVVMLAAGGERSFCYHPGATEALDAQDLRDSGWERAPAGSVLHVATPSKLLRLDIKTLLQKARRKDLVTTLDLDGSQNRDWVRRVWPALPYTDILFGNFGEGRILTGQKTPEGVGRAVLARGVKKLVLKFGARGSLLVCQEGSVRVPGIRVRAVDSTGAGDLFASGFLAWALKNGLFQKPAWTKAEMREALRFANVCGATCVTQAGASLGLATFASLREIARKV